MRRTIATLVGIVVTIFVASVPAAAYVDVGYDPRDQPEYLDVRSSVRRVDHLKHGRSLKVTVRIYEGDTPLNDPNHTWAFYFLLDARGGRAADALMHLWAADMSGAGCRLESRSGHVLKQGNLRTSEKAASCRVPVHALRPTKRIRWKIRTGFAFSPGFGAEVAPNVGMYG